MLGAGPDNAERLCLFGLGLYVPVNFFQLCRDVFLGRTIVFKTDISPLIAYHYKHYWTFSGDLPVLSNEDELSLTILIDIHKI